MTGLDDQEFERWADREGIPVASCAGCGASCSSRARGSRRLERIKGRPWCGRCLDQPEAACGPSGVSGGAEDEEGGWRSFALRALEDA